MAKIKAPTFWIAEGKDKFKQIYPKFSLGLKSITPTDRQAEKMLLNVKLNPYDKKHLLSVLAPFLDSYYKLNIHLHTPVGDAYISEESTELRNLWHLYLVRGRQLIDEIGRKIAIRYELKDTTKGLNARKLKNLQTRLSKEAINRKELENLTVALERHGDAILEFIYLRDRDKECRDTLERGPIISPSGEPNGGVLFNREKNKKYDFTQYLAESFSLIINFFNDILC